MEKSNGEFMKPCANYTLPIEKAQDVYQWVEELKLPDGYSSNLAKCADAENGRMSGIKEMSEAKNFERVCCHMKECHYHT